MISNHQWRELLAPLHLDWPLYRSAIERAYVEWGNDDNAILGLVDAMRFGLCTDEDGRCSCSRARRPMDLMLRAWKDPTEPLGSLAEVFKWGKIALSRGIPASALIAQVYHESAAGRNQASLLGIKATKSCIEKGCHKLMRTRETLPLAAVDALKKLPVPEAYLNELRAKGYNPIGWLLDVVAIAPGGRVDIQCLQDFHYEPGLNDDLERFVELYERHFSKYGKPRWKIGWTARTFLERVTQAPPAYATGAGYVEKVMEYITRFNLEVLDIGIKVTA